MSFTALAQSRYSVRAFQDDSRTVQIQIELWENDYEALPATEDGIPYDVTTTKTGEKIYTIQFTEAGPRYLGIELTG